MPSADSVAASPVFFDALTGPQETGSPLNRSRSADSLTARAQQQRAVFEVTGGLEHGPWPHSTPSSPRGSGWQTPAAVSEHSPLMGGAAPPRSYAGSHVAAVSSSELPLSRVPSLSGSVLEAARMAPWTGGPEPLGMHPREARKTFWSTTLLFGCYGMSWGSWRALLPNLKEDLDASTLAFGSLLAVGVGAFLLTRWTHRQVERRVRIPGATLMSSVAFPVILGFIPRQQSLLRAMATMAAAGGLSELMGHGLTHTTDRLTYEGFPRANALVHTVFGGGELLGGVLAALAQYRDQRAAEHLLQVGIGVGAVGGLIAMWGFRELPAGLHKPPLTPTADTTTRLLAALGLLSSVGKAAVANWVGIYLREHLGASHTEASLGYVAFSAASFLSDLSASHLLRPNTSHLLLGTEAACVPLGILFGLGLGAVWSALVGAATAGLGLGVFRPAVTQTTTRLAASQNKVALEFLTNFQSAGYLFGSLLVGFFASRIDVRVGAALVVVPGAIELILTHQVRKQINDAREELEAVDQAAHQLGRRVDNLVNPVH